MKGDELRQLVRSLFHSWYPSLVRYAYRQCGRLAVAEEVAQEAFMALYLDLSSGKQVDNPKGWTLCVVRRKIFKHERAQQRQREGLEKLAALDPNWGVSRDLDFVDDPHYQLTELFSVLTTREEEVLLLRMQALGYKEIAAELGISRNSVKTLLSRAFRKLRAAASRDSQPTLEPLNRKAHAPKTLQ